MISPTSSRRRAARERLDRARRAARASGGEVCRRRAQIPSWLVRARRACGERDPDRRVVPRRRMAPALAELVRRRARPTSSPSAAAASRSQSTSVSQRSKITAAARAQHLPRSPDVVLRRPRVADREPDHVLAAQLRRRDEDLARSRSRARASSLVVGLDVAEADGREGLRRDDLPAGLGLAPSRRRARRGGRARGSAPAAPRAP